MQIAPKNLVRLAAVAATVCAALLVFKLADSPKPIQETLGRSEEPWSTALSGRYGVAGFTASNAVETPALSLPGGVEAPPARAFHVFYRDGRPADYIRGDTLRVEGDSYLIDDTSGGLPRTVAAIPISAAESVTSTDSEVSDMQR